MSLIDKFLDENAYSDRFCILCGNAFRVKAVLPHIEKYHICPECWLYHKR